LKEAPLPKNEQGRLDKLRVYDILDTPPEAAFDRITRLVADIIGVPMVLVSLIDRERQWFKSRHGLDATQMPRSLAFCAHAILENDLFVVEDATKDERFSDNPLVTEDPNVRFYAGAPLTTPDGFNLGTLCAIDSKPHQLSVQHGRLLEDLAALVVDEMELRLALRSSRQHLAEADNAKKLQNEFVAVISHELRTPLTAIRGSIGLIEAGTAGPVDDKVKELATIANRNAANLLELVNELLEYQKMEAGLMEFAFAEVDPITLVESTVADMAGFAVGRGVTLETQIDGPVPKLGGDIQRLRQLLNNLISNAVKFSPKEAVVTVAVYAEGGNVGFSVTDKGPGIPEDFKDRIFDRFTQASGQGSGDNGPKGTGLGLAISKHIVDAHGGAIRFENSPAAGTTFFVELPLVPPTK
jgi:signal transduction histidine kinase